VAVGGLLDEPFWQRCRVCTGFVDSRTHDPAAEQTRFRVAAPGRSFFAKVTYTF